MAKVGTTVVSLAAGTVSAALTVCTQPALLTGVSVTGSAGATTVLVKDSATNMVWVTAAVTAGNTVCFNPPIRFSTSIVATCIVGTGAYTIFYMPLVSTANVSIAQ